MHDTVVRSYSRACLMWPPRLLIGVLDVKLAGWFYVRHRSAPDEVTAHDDLVSLVVGGTSSRIVIFEQVDPEFPGPVVGLTFDAPSNGNVPGARSGFPCAA